MNAWCRVLLSPVCSQQTQTLLFLT
uniref:Uncharacterized protein n=1 Tax=Anguilla anguilla TaxID=7936 RepID=A0A0E9RZR5_ANGAN